MDFEQYKKNFEKEASNSGYSEQNIILCLNYAQTLFSNKVPVIYNTSHLSALLGYKKDYLKRAVFYTNYFYRNFKITKKNGKLRSISEPLPSLKEIQLWILANILHNVDISPYAKAYKPKTGILENLKFHKNKKLVYTVDLENFFPSIKLESIEAIFRQLGYSSLISNLLSKLCCKDGCLPQGAPTSPCLSNIFFKPLDSEIFTYCKENKIKYTRYADDLTFSGDFDLENLERVVCEILDFQKLKINNIKTKVMTQNMRQVVTGIVVNEKAQVSFNKRNELRQAMYYINKFGLKEHMKRKKITKEHYVEHLIGQVNFILQINPQDKEFQSYKKNLNDLKNKIAVIN